MVGMCWPLDRWTTRIAGALKGPAASCRGRIASSLPANMTVLGPALGSRGLFLPIPLPPGVVPIVGGVNVPLTVPLGGIVRGCWPLEVADEADA